jgi:hypothetical protein
MASMNTKRVNFVINSVELGLFIEANSSSVDQEISRLLWNRKDHYCIHKLPPLNPILNPMYHRTSCSPNVKGNFFILWAERTTFIFLENIAPFFISSETVSCNYVHNSFHNILLTSDTNFFFYIMESPDFCLIPPWWKWELLVSTHYTVQGVYSFRKYSTINHVTYSLIPCYRGVLLI